MALEKTGGMSMTQKPAQPVQRVECQAPPLPHTERTTAAYRHWYQRGQQLALATPSWCRNKKL